MLIVAERGLETFELAACIHHLSGRSGAFHRVHAPELVATGRSGDAESRGYEVALRTLEDAILFTQGGTLFIEEIASLPRFAQARIERLLSDQVRGRPDSDARIIASTSVDLYVEAEDNDFREDLICRLVACTVHLPALRERGSDVVEIAVDLLEHHPWLEGIPHLSLEPDAALALEEYEWPGNRLQLEAVLLSAAQDGGGVIQLKQLDDAYLGLHRVFDPLWPTDSETPPGAGWLRELDPEPVYTLVSNSAKQEAADLALTRRVLGEEQVAAYERTGRLTEVVLLVSLAHHRLLAQLEQEGIVRERELRQVTMMEPPQALRVVEVLVEDGVIVPAPTTGRQRAWRRPPET